MNSEYIKAIFVAIWGVTIPGLPIVFLLKMFFKKNIDVLVATPFISILFNYLIVSALNIFGIHLDLKIIAISSLAIGTVAVLTLARSFHDMIALPYKLLLTLCFTTTTTVFVWLTAYQDYVFVAPNTDGKHHNFYISRIIQISSVLPSDVLVASPMTPLDRSDDFYPLAWHASIAVPSALLDVRSPVSSIVSTLFFLSVILPIGIWKLTPKLTGGASYTAPFAAMLVQVAPLFPGIPISWGAMPSVIGISLLPGATYLLLRDDEMMSLKNLSLIGVVFAALTLIHPPEAFSFIFIFGLLVVSRELKNLKTVLVLLTPVAIVVGIIFILGLNQIITRKFTELLNLQGAVASLDFLISGLFQMNINTGHEQQLFALLFIAGLLLGTTQSLSRNLFLVVAPLVLVFFASGADSQPLSRLRWLTTPWYASYERTLWILVPFVAIIVATSVFLWVGTEDGRLSYNLIVRSMVGLVVMCLLFGNLTSSTVQVLRKGQWENSALAKSDLNVFKISAQLQGDEGVIYTERNQGTKYAFMYEGVRVSNGIYGFTGFQREGLQIFADLLRNICDSPEQAAELIKTEKISGVLLSTRNLSWEAPTWSGYEITNLTGFEIVARGQNTYLLKPALEKCL